jgi:ribose 5-phosphate isomerase B
MVRIAIGSDHRGYRLKQGLETWLREQKIAFQDFGCLEERPVDYPDIAIPVAQAVVRGEYDLGILIDSTGIGMSIVANKVPGIRAAPCDSIYTARMARENNDANVLCLGGEVVGPKVAEEILRTYLDMSFQGGRHSRRIEKISAFETRVIRDAAKKMDKQSEG